MEPAGLGFVGQGGNFQQILTEDTVRVSFHGKVL